ncbi:LysM peptidoglycan-binding domain-containing protein [Isoptericola sp. NEAU-Y5]|uniref:LysM peptidoglycan-binding domain-containing protein n=1 Tax=Isoptericola luteus TaxID=2879484 RepID=A0ABS7ZFC0_9MICO|nr:LysM peptidoglycan-binding domain-containing protein [Isoptericola sp. NEAU-Y5]MCA5893172.1 LysM peptidoglycan-binding domain-containing protein [Isoptericola sp. NEAU-Y5]
MATVTSAPGPWGLGGLRLTRRGRGVVTALAAMLAASAGLVGQQAMAEAPRGPVEVRLHTVAPGETLWEYAREVAVTGEDVRDVVAELRELNGLRTVDLRAGQVVLLPADDGER